MSELVKILNEYENYSKTTILQEPNSSWFLNNADIRWHANCVERFEDEKINPLYIQDEYAKKTRWDFWNDSVELLLKNNIKTNIDIGCANNQFSFLCLKKGITSFGIDPRESCVNVSNDVFNQHFGNIKYGYVGNLKTFIEFFNTHPIKVDCITALNFLHGEDHISSEIREFFGLLPNITQYILISEPQWYKLGLSRLTKDYTKIDTLNNGVIHTLYQISN